EGSRVPRHRRHPPRQRPRAEDRGRAGHDRAGRAAALAGHLLAGTGRRDVRDGVAHPGHAVVPAGAPAAGPHGAVPLRADRL
ncbi:MAG: Threonine dehydrogenase and related Zn-dependent dehydrogenases, partial [uncultured Gemmatimonadaceae bacterium]